MKKPAVIYSEKYLMLNFGPGHPFQPERFKETLALMKELLDIRIYEPRYIEENLLVELGIHSPHYIRKVKECSRLTIPYLSEFSTDTPCFEGIFEWGLSYCGGAIRGCDLILSGNTDIVFNIAGGYHHAKYNADGGFCVFNDCALALEYLRQKGKKVAYIDIDGHAGEGTYLILYDKPILKISIHEDPNYLYPGRGFLWEIGERNGKGYTLNVPLAPYSGDPDLIEVFDKVVISILEGYRPQAIVFQCGVDGYFDDPLTHLNYTINGYIHIATRLRELGIPILMCSGGGYSNDAPKLHTVILAYLTDQKQKVKRLVDLLQQRIPKNLKRNTKEYTKWLIEEIKTNHPVFSLLNLGNPE